MSDKTKGKQEFLLTKAVESVTQHGFIQVEALGEKERTLRSLQVTLSEVERKSKTAEHELRCKVREILILEAEMENKEHEMKVLHGRYASLSRENTELLTGISEAEENARAALDKFNGYRTKMDAHRAAVCHAASQTASHNALEEKRALVRMLTQRREELRDDLQNPNGNAVQKAKSEVGCLKGEISVMRKTVAQRREEVQRQFETQAQIQKDIEIQNRRYEAIVKRLHCQLSRAQATHRQMSEDIQLMERELAELKRQLESSQDSVVSGL